MRSEIEFETTLIIKEREKREMGSGASTKKVQHLNDALRKIEEDFDDDDDEDSEEEGSGEPAGQSKRVSPAPKSFVLEDSEDDD